MATNQQATTGKLLEAVFFVVRTVAAAMQWHGKNIIRGNQSRRNNRGTAGNGVLY
jgi:hypothetical protein